MERGAPARSAGSARGRRPAAGTRRRGQRAGRGGLGSKAVWGRGRSQVRGSRTKGGRDARAPNAKPRGTGERPRSNGPSRPPGANPNQPRSADPRRTRGEAGRRVEDEGLDARLDRTQPHHPMKATRLGHAPYLPLPPRRAGIGTTTPPESSRFFALESSPFLPAGFAALRLLM